MRPSNEALFITSLINSQSPEDAELFGIAPEILLGYTGELRWVMSYWQTYGKCPSKEALLTKFPDFPFTDANDTEFLADELRQAHIRREIAKVVRDASVALQGGDLEEAQLAMAKFQVPSVIVPLRNVLLDHSFLDDYDKPVEALTVPWKTLQKTTGGLRKGDLWYVAARLSQGKSWLLADVISHSLMDGRRVVFYSLEMTQRQVLTRIHVILGRMLGETVDHIEMRDRLYDRNDYIALMKKISDNVPGELFIHDPSKGSVSPLTLAAQTKDIDLAVIDYVQLMANPAGSRAIDDWRNMASISNQLKEVAIANDLPIMAAAQINREGDQNHWRPPKVKNLAQSDALGQDADVVLTHKQYSKTTMVYSVEKNRHGEAGVYYWTRFLPNSGQFNEISRDLADDYRQMEEVD